MKGGRSARERQHHAWRVLRPGHNLGRGGFTIIEVLIVLAVSGFLFVGAAILIAGRQSQTEFDQASRQIQAQIQQTINEVAVGYYPKTGNFKCTVSGANPPVVDSGVSEQGANSDCIFVGKVMQFKMAGTSPEQFKTYTLVGRRLSSTAAGQEATSRATALPVVIAPTTSNLNTPDNSENNLLGGGLTTASMVWGASANPIGAVGFMQSFAKYSGSTIQSGAQSVVVIPVANTALGATAIDGATAINANFATSAFDPTAGVRICFASAGTDQSALITIGGSQGQSSVTLAIKSNKTCT